MGNIEQKSAEEKPKGKLREFLHNSKKLIQAPKELPEITTGKRPEQLELPPMPPARQPAQAARMPALQAPQIQQKQPAFPQVSQSVSSFSSQPSQTTQTQSLQANRPVKDFRLPQIEHPARREARETREVNAPIIQIQKRQAANPSHDEDLKKFEEAISSINIDMIHSETPAESFADEPERECRDGRENREGYYKPPEMGEGYFSEIQHFIRNKDVNEIIDDVLKKDFLTDMKDYHESKAQGKPFFMHKEDLKAKLGNKMSQLQKLEEEWHGIRARIESEDKRKKLIEKEIELESQELKEIFKQVKISQWLDMEAPPERTFRLVNGQELKSLNDLRKALSYMTDQEFSHHVNAERNDFAAWVKEIFQNFELYDKIVNARTREALQQVLQNPL